MSTIKPNTFANLANLKKLILDCNPLEPEELEEFSRAIKSYQVSFSDSIEENIF